MPKSITCPACQTIISAAAREPGAALQCPRCGTRLVARARAKPAGGESGPPGAGARPPGRGRRPPPKRSLIDFLGIGTALGAAALLLAASYGLSWGVRLALGSGSPRAAPAANTSQPSPAADPEAAVPAPEGAPERAP
jgi:predicted RNA-binding Zn-ribbon protein involved in translation (DUF1610 family)